MDNNFEVFVERDPQRIFDDKEFEEWAAKPSGNRDNLADTIKGRM